MGNPIIEIDTEKAVTDRLYLTNTIRLTMEYPEPFPTPLATIR